MKLEHVLKCQRSGVPVAVMRLETAFNTLPYLSLWNDHVAYHPIFCIPFQKLKEHTIATWNAVVEQEEPEESKVTDLRLCFSALLYSLDCIKQDYPALPPIEIVKDHIHSLLQLASWKFWLESKRFRFPTLNLSRRNGNLDFSNIGDYLSVCYEVRRDYENGVSEASEKLKLAETERALAMLNSEWVKPINRNLLWRWVRAHLPEKYQPDATGWLGTLFLGNKAAIIEFERGDIDLMDEILQSSLPVGTGIMSQVRKRIQEVAELWESHHEAWEILPEVPELLVNGEKQKPADPGPEPQLSSFPTRGAYLQAAAKWKLAKAGWERAQE